MCDQFLALKKSQNPTWSAFTVEFIDNGGDGLCWVRSSGGNVVASDAFAAVAASCPANSTPIGSTNTCGCLQGYQESGNACVPAASQLESFCQLHSQNKSTWPQTGTIGSTSNTPEGSCFMPDPPFPGNDAGKGCQMTLGDVVKVPKDGDPLLHNWSGTGNMTGAVCGDAPATDAEPESKDDKCPGGFAGTVNGEEKCIPAEPDKGIEGVKTGSSTDANGTKHDTKETTKCEGTVCTTTTTTTSTTTTGSTSTSTTSVTSSLADKCAKDPSNPVCKKTNGAQGATGSPEGCAANSSGEGCGGSAAGIGELYTGKEETVEGIMNKASTDLKATAIGSAVNGFFTINAGGSCPAMVWNVPYLNATVTLPNLCSELAVNMFAVMRGVLLLIAGFMAFRIAVDN